MQGFGRQAVMEDAQDRDYTLVFEEYPDYLFALVHGDKYGYEVLVGFLKEIADRCKELGYKQVLIEENISASTSKEDAYRVASEMPELGYAGIRIAYVDRFADQSEVNEFGKDVAIDNGIDVRLFKDQADAHEWLSAK